MITLNTVANESRDFMERLCDRLDALYIEVALSESEADTFTLRLRADNLNDLISLANDYATFGELRASCERRRWDSLSMNRRWAAEYVISEIDRVVGASATV